MDSTSNKHGYSLDKINLAVSLSSSGTSSTATSPYASKKDFHFDTKAYDKDEVQYIDSFTHHRIDNGLRVHNVIEVTGYFTGSSFTIDLLAEEHGISHSEQKKALHLSVSIDGRWSTYTSLDNKTTLDGKYQPISNKNFKVTIITKNDSFELQLNDAYIHTQQYLVPLENVTHIGINGDAEFTAVEFRELLSDEEQMATLLSNDDASLSNQNYMARHSEHIMSEAKVLNSSSQSLTSNEINQQNKSEHFINNENNLNVYATPVGNRNFNSDSSTFKKQEEHMSAYKHHRLRSENSLKANTLPTNRNSSQNPEKPKKHRSSLFKLKGSKKSKHKSDSNFADSKNNTTTLNSVWIGGEGEEINVDSKERFPVSKNIEDNTTNRVAQVEPKKKRRSLFFIKSKRSKEERQRSESSPPNSKEEKGRKNHHSLHFSKHSAKTSNKEKTGNDKIITEYSKVSENMHTDGQVLRSEQFGSLTPVITSVPLHLKENVSNDINNKVQITSSNASPYAVSEKSKSGGVRRGFHLKPTTKESYDLEPSNSVSKSQGDLYKQHGYATDHSSSSSEKIDIPITDNAIQSNLCFSANPQFSTTDQYKTNAHLLDNDNSLLGKNSEANNLFVGDQLTTTFPLHMKETQDGTYANKDNDTINIQNSASKGTSEFINDNLLSDNIDSYVQSNVTLPLHLNEYNEIHVSGESYTKSYNLQSPETMAMTSYKDAPEKLSSSHSSYSRRNIIVSSNNNLQHSALPIENNQSQLVANSKSVSSHEYVLDGAVISNNHEGGTRELVFGEDGERHGISNEYKVVEHHSFTPRQVRSYKDNAEQKAKVTKHRKSMPESKKQPKQKKQKHETPTRSASEPNLQDDKKDKKSRRISDMFRRLFKHKKKHDKDFSSQPNIQTGSEDTKNLARLHSYDDNSLDGRSSSELSLIGRQRETSQHTVPMLINEGALDLNSTSRSLCDDKTITYPLKLQPGSESVDIQMLNKGKHDSEFGYHLSKKMDSTASFASDNALLIEASTERPVHSKNIFSDELHSQDREYALNSIDHAIDSSVSKHKFLRNSASTSSSSTECSSVDSLHERLIIIGQTPDFFKRLQSYRKHEAENIKKHHRHSKHRYTPNLENNQLSRSSSSEYSTSSISSVELSIQPAKAIHFENNSSKRVDVASKKSFNNGDTEHKNSMNTSLGAEFWNNSPAPTDIFSSQLMSTNNHYVNEEEYKASQYNGGSLYASQNMNCNRNMNLVTNFADFRNLANKSSDLKTVRLANKIIYGCQATLVCHFPTTWTTDRPLTFTLKNSKIRLDDIYIRFHISQSGTVKINSQIATEEGCQPIDYSWNMITLKNNNDFLNKFYGKQVKLCLTLRKKVLAVSLDDEITLLVQCNELDTFDTILVSSVDIDGLDELVIHDTVILPYTRQVWSRKLPNSILCNVNIRRSDRNFNLTMTHSPTNKTSLYMNLQYSILETEYKYGGDNITVQNDIPWLPEQIKSISIRFVVSNHTSSEISMIIYMNDELLTELIIDDKSYEEGLPSILNVVGDCEVRSIVVDEGY